MGKCPIKEELAEWRKIVRRALRDIDKPQRLDKDYTRGKYGIAYDPERPKSLDEDEE